MNYIKVKVQLNLKNRFKKIIYIRFKEILILKIYLFIIIRNSSKILGIL